MSTTWMPLDEYKTLQRKQRSVARMAGLRAIARSRGVVLERKFAGEYVSCRYCIAAGDFYLRGLPYGCSGFYCGACAFWIMALPFDSLKLVARLRGWT